MESLSDMGRWISENEALLSGIAALIVVGGVVFSPIGLGLRRWLGRPVDSDLGPAPPAAPPVPPAAPPAAPPADAASGAARGGSTRAGATGSRAPDDRPSIAVLPFMNMSDDSEQAFLADGMTEDIITGLAATRHLYVASRNSTFAYKGQSPDIRDVGRDLGVRYVLEGSVRRVGDKLRTTVQLIEAETGGHLWAEKYDRLYADIFEVQDEVVSDIAGALSLQITQAEVSRSRSEPPSSLGAWELVQRTMVANFQETPSLQKSRDMLDMLERAVSLDADYAYARAAYAWLLFSAAINGWAEDPMATIREGNTQLTAALDLDTSDPLTQYYIGAAYLYSGRNEIAVRFLERSLAGNPHQPDAMVHLGLAWGFLAEYERAYGYFDQADRMAALRTTSGPYGWYRGIVLGLEGRYEEAIPIVSQFLEGHPRYATARCTLGIAHEMLGHPDKAKVAIERACELDPGLNVNGIALNLAAHPNPEQGARREAILRRYWPAA